MRIDWSRRSPREKSILIAGVILLILFLLSELIIMPMIHSVTAQKSVMQDNQSLLAWMQTTVQEIQEAKQTATPVQTVSLAALLETVDQSLRASPMAKQIELIQQGAVSNTVEIKVQGVSFDTLTTWLVHIQTSQAIEVKTLSIDRKNMQGIVDAQIVLGAMALT